MDDDEVQNTTYTSSASKDALLDDTALPQRKRKRFWGLMVLLAAVGAIFLFFFLRLQTAPDNFPTNTPIEVAEGSSLRDVAVQLEEQNVVRSALFFQFMLKTTFGEAHVRAETYYFERPLRAEEVAEALVQGEFILPPVRLTIPEGLRVDQIDEIVSAHFDEIDSGEFSEAAHGLEGYLFPDTYYATQSLTAPELVALMSKNFEEKIGTIADELSASGKSLDDVITMASIIEREARDTESKHIVSGILWERLRIEMPLQVDAAFEYVYKRSAATLSSEDLLIDSPYNTYKNRGLPPTPIVNPGLESIAAALNPTPSPYLYYITAPDGTFYYAETFEAHKRNIAEHLR